MKRNLLLTTTTVLMLGAGVAMAQSSTSPSTANPATQPNAPATQGSIQQQQQNPATAPGAVGDKSAMGSAVSFEKMMGKDVYGADGQKLGSIEDIIMDPQTGRAQLAVIERGGLLGIGGKEVAIDYTLLGVEGDRIVAKQMTEAQVKDMPEFTYRDNTVSYSKDRNRNQGTTGAPNKQ